MGNKPNWDEPDKPRLAALDMKSRLDQKAYRSELARVLESLRTIQQAYLKTGHSAAIIFEGWDAAGKGGTIRCMSSALDARGFQVWPISAPRQYYLERHYLTRFFERSPPKGAISVFDRSWYGRVLVERVEGIAGEEDWTRAYREINEFERFLHDHGTRIIKLFLHITPDEQLRRFRRRILDPTKRWKLSYEDFRNRKKWSDYESATEDMFRETSTAYAPWYAIPANSKKYARVEALKIIAKRLSSGVDLAPAELDPEILREAREMLEIDPTLLKVGGRRVD
jgi:polyphosphate kinase 2 (PPK2 family)